ncbi:MAG: FkbM family methyltransferase [Gaiellaceae bacterium]
MFRDVEVGFYVDVGAGEPSEGSVTRLFYDRGWSGINVEPGPAFEALSSARARDVNIQAAVGESEGEVPFYLTYPDLGMSTLDLEAHAHVPEAIERYEEVSVPEHRLETILREHAEGRTIHFLKVDVEGAERDVLASSDWRSFRPIVVVVEAVESWSTAPAFEEWEGILAGEAYEFAAFDGINRFYVDRAHTDLGPILAYPVSALDRFVPASLHESQAEVAALREEADELRVARDDGRLQRERLVEENARLWSDLDSLRAARDDLRVSLEATQLERRRVSEANDRLRSDLDAVYRSRTWRAGRLVAAAGRPATAVARRLPKRRRKPLSPAGAYTAAVAKGEPWHFPRGKDRTRRRASPSLDPLIRAFGNPYVPLAGRGAMRVAEKIERLGWADEQSLRDRLLSCEERQAVVEADAVVQLVNGVSVHSAGGERERMVVVDARCLQDRAYRRRGVGLHAQAVVEATRAAAQGDALVLLTNAELPALDPEVLTLADRTIATPFEVRLADIALFVELSPMTASLAPTIPFLASADCLTASVVYDFIPSAFPSAYLQTAASALSNRARLEALRHYDLLLPISRTTEHDCRRVLGEDVRTVATGVGDPLRDVPPADRNAADPFMLVPVGGDSRKNVAASIAALAHHLRGGGSPLEIIVTGSLTGTQTTALEELARATGLPSEALELPGNVPPDQLAALYESAELAFVGSFAEGFSIPVAEAVLRSTPVVASDIGVHRELLGPGPWLAPPTDIPGLGRAISHCRANRSSVTESERATLGDTADPEAVLARVRDALGDLLARRPTRRRVAPRRARPRIAVVSPFPPHRSGVADFTAFTFRQVAKHADVEVYSSAADPSPRLPMRRLSAAPYLDTRFDTVINVVGNSHFHFPILDLLGAYGGACIAHDASMVESYGYDRGVEWAAQLLSTDARSIEPEQVADLMREPDRFASIGYDIIARQASPLIVHGTALAERIRTETGVRPCVVPFVPYNLPHDEIDHAARLRARESLRLQSDQLHVATFGLVDRRTKGLDLIVGATAWLRSWKIPAHLHIVGEAPSGERRVLEKVADDLGVVHHVTYHGHVARSVLDQLLLGVDVAVQIRTSALLSLSGGLTDCVAFGIPTVTTTDIAAELDVPFYVATTTPTTSSLLLAEAIEGLSDARRRDVETIEAARREYLERRSVDAYARSLLEALEIEAA